MLHEIYYRYPKKFPLPMVLDGSTGTSLMREGMPSGSCTERWVLEHPDIFRKIQQGYIHAGSDALYTPTFGGNRAVMERADFHEPEANEKLARLSVGRGKLVGGDLAPTGLFIEPFGDTPFDTVIDIYREQVKELEAAGVDFYISETNISLQEARAAVLAVREISDKPVFVTMTVDDSGNTLSGESLMTCLLSLAELGIVAFGANCSQGPDGMLPLLAKLTPTAVSLGIALIAKPNAGLPHDDANSVRTFDSSAEDFGKTIPAFLKAGIFILGGCCGTDDTYIEKIRTCVDSADISPDFEKADTSKLAAYGRSVIAIDSLPSPIFADDSFYDNAAMCEDFVYAQIENEAGADIFLENAPMLGLPCAVTGNKDAIAKVKRNFCGKLFIC